MSSIAPQFIAPKEGRTAFRWAGDEEELVNHPFNQGLSVLQGIYGTLETAREHNWAFVDDAKNDLPNKLPEARAAPARRTARPRAHARASAAAGIGTHRARDGKSRSISRSAEESRNVGGDPPKVMT